jgi:hypothetical protein
MAFNPLTTYKMAGIFLLKRPQKQIFVLKSRRLFEISLNFVELFLFSSLLMGRCKIGRDLHFTFFFFLGYAIFWFMGLAYFWLVLV